MDNRNGGRERELEISVLSGRFDDDEWIGKTVWLILYGIGGIIGS